MSHNLEPPIMLIPRKKNVFMFGDLIAAVYGACGRRRAKGILRLAVNARLVAFQGPLRFLISRR